MRLRLNRDVSSLYVTVMLFVGLFMISPGIEILGLDRNIISFIILVYLFVLLLFDARRVYGWYYYLSFVVIALSFVPILRWGIDLKHGFIVILPLISLLLLLLSKKKEIEIFVKVATFFLFLILAGSYIGFFAQMLLIIKPVEFDYISNKNLLLFGTTFASYSFGGNIRPGGIYDEPGAFSFVICIIVLVRSVLGLNEKVSWILLIFGFITFSVAHLVFVLIFLLKDINDYKKYIIYLISFLFLYVVYNYVVINTPFGEAVDLLLGGRIEYDDQYLFKGNNRGERFVNAINFLNLDVFLFGLDARLFYDYYNSSNDYMMFGENVLSPIIVRGIFSSLIYYMVVFVIVYYIFNGKKYFIIVGLLLLIMQRPYVINSMGYSFLVFIPLVIYYKNKIEIKYDSFKEK